MQEAENGDARLGERVRALQGAIALELSRLARGRTGVSESYSYEPALQEADRFLERFFAADTPEARSSALYDAGFSIRYYLDGIAEQ